MWEEEVPPVSWENWCGPSQDSKEVVFESANSPFCSIAAMDIRGHKLESAPICSDCIFVGCAGFVVQDVDNGFTVGCGEPGMDVLVGRNAVCIMLAGEGSYQYGVGVGV